MNQLVHSPEMATAWTNLSASAFFSGFVCRAASAPRVAARKSAIARDSVMACPPHGQPFGDRKATGGVSQTPSAGLTGVVMSRARRHGARRLAVFYADPEKRATDERRLAPAPPSPLA